MPPQVGVNRRSQSMATIAAVQRSGPAIRAALAEHGVPGQVNQFGDEMRAVLIRAADELDLVEVDAVRGERESTPACLAIG